ncbi:Pentatricopeptide repeat-containing protein [Hirschfeldia incana]|nr:Pentatricopeptide repeat-containing protein [Hirschfeldia incana]
MSYLSRLLLRGTTNSFTTPKNSREYVSAFTAPATFSTSKRKPSLAALLYFLNSEKDPKQIAETFKTACQREKFRQNLTVYENTVRRLASAKKFDLIEEILEEQSKYPDMSKQGFVARIISLYGRAGMFENAQKVFDEMPERKCKRSLPAFNALLNACVNSEKLDLVEGMFKELPGKLSIEPDIRSYNALIKGLCRKGSLTEAVALLDEIESKGLNPDIYTFNTLLHASYTKGHFDVGEELWGRMVEKDVARDMRSYNTRLLGLALEKRSEEMVKFFGEFKRNRRFKRDVFTVTAMARGLAGVGEVDEAKAWYQRIEQYNVRPMKGVYSSLLPAMCKAGDLEFAVELCKEIFAKRILVDEAVVQEVVDALVEGSKQEDAEEIIELANKDGYLKFKLRVSSKE